MAKIKHTVEIDSKTKNLKKTSKEIDGVGKSLKKTRKSAQSADRSLKGAAQASSNTTKNFSKMSQGITGGLVPAYATLAANLFALDAAFRFLKGAADFRVLREGQVAFAAATGIAYQSLSKDIQAATRGMISFSEASQAAAIGRAAGLSSGQLRELSEAAFTVSVALGRDVTDSFNRLVRGVTKAEPELLDELGIILRLEEASTKYAAALGLNKNQLSIYQKSQAVVNEVLGQAEEKFGKINEIMDPTANALAQVGIAFDELLNTVRPAIAAIAEPIAKFIAGNTTNAAIAMGLFASSILKSLIPSTNELRIRQSEAAEARITEIERLKVKEQELATKMKQLNNLSPSQRKFATKIGADRLGKGGKIGQILADGKKLSKAQISNLHSQLSREAGMFKNMSDKKRAYYKKILLQMSNDYEGFVTKTLVGTEKVTTGFRLKWMAASNAVKGMLSTVSSAASKVGMFLSGLLGYVAIIGMVFMAFKGFMEYLNKDANKMLEKFNEDVDSNVGSLKTLNEELLKMSQVRADGLIVGKTESLLHSFEAVQSVDFNKTVDSLFALGRNASINQEKFNELGEEFNRTLRTLGKMNPEFETFRQKMTAAGGMTEDLAKELFILRDKIATVGAALKALNNNSKEMVKQQNRIAQSLPKIPMQDMLNIIKSNVQQYKELNKAGQDYHSELRSELGTLELYTFFQKEAIELSKQMSSAKTLQMFGDLGGMTTTNRILKVEQKRFKLAEEMNKLEKMNLQIFNTKDKQKLIQLKQNRDIQLDMIKASKIALDLETKRASLMFSTYHGVYKDLEANLGKAIGAGMRGDSSMFENIGKAFTTTITDSIGGFLSEQLLEDTIGQILPTGKTEAEKLEDAAERHGRIIKENIENSGFAHGAAIRTASQTMVDGLKEVQRRILEADIETEGKRKAELVSRLSAAEEKGKKLGMLKDETSVNTLIESEGFDDYARNEKLKGLSAARRDIAEQLMADIAKAGGEGFIRLFNKAGESKVVTGKDIQQATTLKNGKTDSEGFFYDPSRSTPTGLSQTIGVTAKSGRGNRGRHAFDTLLDNILFGEDGYDDGIEKYKAKLFTDISANSRAFDQNQKLQSTITTAIRGSEITQEGMEEKINKLTGVKTAPNDPSAERSLLQMLFDNAAVGDIVRDPETGLFTTKQSTMSSGIAAAVETHNTEDPVYVDSGKERRDEFSKNLNQFSGVIGAMGALTGQEEKTAKIMAKVAQIQLMISIYERAKMALETGGGSFFKTIGQFFTGTVPAGRDGGVMNNGYRSFSGGGVSDGPSSGYGAVLHGKEAVVPLPNNRSIPVEMKGKNNGPVNTTINVNMADGSSNTTSDEETGKQFAQAINMAVLEEIGKQQRPGGLLSG